MIEALATDTGKWFITQGILGVMFLVAASVAGYFYLAKEKAVKSCQDTISACNGKIAEMYEKRIAEALSLLTAFNTNSQALSGLGQGLAERATLNASSLQALSTAITLLAEDFKTWKAQQASDQQNGQTFWRDRVNALETKLGDALRRLEIIQARVPGATG